MDKLEEIKQKYPEIAAMTVKDVVETDEFKEGCEDAINKSWKQLIGYENKTRTVLGRHPLRLMHHKGTLKFDYIKAEYLKIIDKHSGLSNAQRQVIVVIGSMAYTKAVELLMKKHDEKA